MPPAAAAPDAEIAGRAEAIVREHEPGRLLLLALEALDTETGRPRSIALFEAVWGPGAADGEYWIYHRMSQVYGALGHGDACALLATLAIQIEPFNRVSDHPHRLLLRYFRGAGRIRDAAELCVRRHGLCPEPVLLSDKEVAALLAEAGPLALSPPPAGRQDRPLIEPDVRKPRLWRAYGSGVPLCLRELQRNMSREPIAMAELRDAEVLIGQRRGRGVRAGRRAAYRPVRALPSRRCCAGSSSMRRMGRGRPRRSNSTPPC